MIPNPSPHVIPNLCEESRCQVPPPLTLCHPNAPQEILLASTHPTVPIPRRLPHLPSITHHPSPSTTANTETNPFARRNVPRGLLSNQRPPNIPVGASVERSSPSHVVPLHSPHSHRGGPSWNRPLHSTVRPTSPVGAVREPPFPIFLRLPDIASHRAKNPPLPLPFPMKDLSVIQRADLASTPCPLFPRRRESTSHPNRRSIPR